ncbi:yrdC domain-containing protein, mitochondrial isoform X1 [Hemiscyllium ocellatum]|uniref:yrdC domain-containing protein, mitochondrial isoform X1 n=1 Tax=Hemiscyllium ocellatum TaxID=170820 RepID=UPI002966DC50|nr:yrdC domain-containing protein, mitochondrial isoform X1 [Hemiscyllium ocellatum]
MVTRPRRLLLQLLMRSRGVEGGLGGGEEPDWARGKAEAPVPGRLLLLPPPGPGPALGPQPRGGVGAVLFTPDWKDALTEAVKVLHCGQVVAVPTDTIYGITCLAQNSEAIRRIYEIKGRNEDKPLAICVGHVEDIYKYCKVTVSDQVLRDLLPGPVTLVFRRSEELNKDLNPFTDLVGVRIPKHPFIQKLAEVCGEPLALTSANLSSQTSTLTTEEFRDLWPLLGLVVDGGPIGDMTKPECRLGSTVINLGTPGKYSIIRPGCAFNATVEVLQHKHGLSFQS